MAHSPQSFCSPLIYKSVRSAWLSGELASGAEEEGPILGVAVAVEAQDRHFIAGEAGVQTLAVEEVFDGDVERAGDARDVAAELAGAIGLPLGDGAAADIAGGGELILGESAGEPAGADSGADRERGI